MLAKGDVPFPKTTHTSLSQTPSCKRLCKSQEGSCFPRGCCWEDGGRCVSNKWGATRQHSDVTAASGYQVAPGGGRLYISDKTSVRPDAHRAQVRKPGAERSPDISLSKEIAALLVEGEEKHLVSLRPQNLRELQLESLW